MLGCEFGCNGVDGVAELQSTALGADLNLQKGHQEAVSVDASGAGGELELWAARGKCPPLMGSFCAPEVSLSTDQPGPLLLLRDLEGYSASLGVSSTVAPATGAERRTSAASIVPWGKPAKDGKQAAVWQAPY